TNRVETAEDHGFRRVIDDQVDPGRVFQGPDIPTFPTDDAALHLVAGNGHHRDGGLRGLLGSHALHRSHQDIAGAFLALLFDDRLAVANLLGDLLAEL